MPKNPKLIKKILELLFTYGSILEKGESEQFPEGSIILEYKDYIFHYIPQKESKMIKGLVFPVFKVVILEKEKKILDYHSEQGYLKKPGFINRGFLVNVLFPEMNQILRH